MKSILQDLDTSPDDADDAEVRAGLAPSHMEDMPTGKPEGIQVELGGEPDPDAGGGELDPDEQGAAGDGEQGAEAAGIGTIDDDDDEDMSRYSINVQKRIKREIRQKQKLREEKAEIERELAELRAEKARADADKAAAEIDAKIAAAQEKLKSARAEIDHDAEAAAVSEIAELHAAKQDVRRRAEEVKQKTDKPDTRAVNEYADEWVERNAYWFQDKRFSAQRQVALEINGELLAKDKKNDRDPAFYEELDRRLRKELRERGMSLPQRPNRPRPAVSGVDTSGAGNAQRHQQGMRRVSLSQADLATMRSVGLDPSNKEHLQRYAREKTSGQRSDT
jgi:hypothetical protein